MNALEKLTKARAGLVISSPFFASIALHLKLKEDIKCETAYTDSVVLGYNPSFIESLTVAEVKTLICHEVLHIAMLHPFRRQDRNHKRWNIACDYAINPILQNSGFTLPEGGLVTSEYSDLEAEKIYDMLPDIKDMHQDYVMIGDVRDYREKEAEDGYQKQLAQQLQDIKVMLTQATLVAKAQGMMPGKLDRMINEILQPKLPWQEILSRFITEYACNDYNWKNPNKRYLYSDIYLPGVNSPTLGTIAVIIDTSGSVNQKELDIFASELKSILSSYPDTTIEVIYVDSKVANVQTLTLHELELQAKGGGGTDFRPGFEYIEKETLNPSCIIYFTDGFCNSFPDEPDYPTLWAITSSMTFKPPFGEVISISLQDKIHSKAR